MSFAENAKALYTDAAPVRYTNGCALNQSATVGMIAKRLVEKRFFLAAEEREVDR